MAPPLGSGALRVKGGQLQLNSAKLEAPGRIYDADLGGLELAERVVTLTLGKFDLNDKGRLRTRLQIKMGEDAFLKYFWKVSVKFRDRLRDFVGTTDHVAADAPQVMQALHDFSDWANVCKMAHAGQYGIIDFYELSPTGVAQFAKFMDSSGLDIRPVVRVQIPARKLLALLDLAEGLEADILSRVEFDPAEMEEE